MIAIHKAKKYLLGFRSLLAETPNREIPAEHVSRSHAGLRDSASDEPTRLAAGFSAVSYRDKVIYRNVDGSYSVNDLAEHFPSLEAAKLSLDTASKPMN